MSSNLLESNGEGSDRKGSSTSIRKYFLIKPSNSSPTSTTNTKPLSCANDNIVKEDLASKTTDSTSTTIKSTTKSIESTTKISSQKNKTSSTNNTRSIVDLIQTQRKSQSTKTSSSSSRPSNKIDMVRPGSLKRSHSAISHLDTVNESWMSAPITSKQQKTCEKAVGYDRLTPVITDMDSARYIMSQPSSQSSQGCSDADNEGEASTYQERVARACGIDSSKRILGFAPNAPANKKVNIRKNAPQSPLNTNKSTSIKRRILTSPEKILDAPYMADDYYLNVLDWSSLNVVAVGLGKSIYLWSADNGTIQSLNYDYDDPVASVSWSGDGTYLAVGTTSGDTQIWDVQANTKLRSMTGQDDRIGVLSWDKHLVSSGARNGSIFHHDVRMAKHTVKELYGHEDEVCGLEWRWDGQMLASGGNDNTVNIWDARSATPKFTRRNHVGAVKALAWCPWNHNCLATGGGRDDKNIHFWNTLTGTRTNTIQAGSQVTSLRWSKHYKEITSTHGLPHNQVTVWGYPTLNKIIDIPAHESRILHSALSPDGQVLATAAADENLKFWRIFEANGKAPLGTESTRLTEKKETELRRSKSIR